ncbi:hypothetical protein [Paenibacillus campi]|uniref:hypothetical protein n=1 Tax=Paenibacillus campi TaxID=3106031 RepID=UPI002AFFD6C5|nr:hypothetical protein [Paenibacillus sp. SGZ-1009]
MEALQSTLFQQSPAVLIGALITALALLASVYGFSAAQRRLAERERMRRIEISLDYWTRAAGHLYPLVTPDTTASYVAQPPGAALPLLAERILACKAAPYADRELIERIDQYLDERSRQSMLLLYRTLQLQISRLTRERHNLLARGEQPQWGMLFGLTLRPLLPVLVLLLEGALLLYSLYDLHNAYTAGPPIPFFAIVRFISCTGSLLLLYGVLSAAFRESGRRASFVIIALLIAALSLLHLIGWTAAPYILLVQVLMFVVGYRFTREPKRKERPYAGEYE